MAKSSPAEIKTQIEQLQELEDKWENNVPTKIEYEYLDATEKSTGL